MLRHTVRRTRCAAIRSRLPREPDAGACRWRRRWRSTSCQVSAQKGASDTSRPCAESRSIKGATAVFGDEETSTAGTWVSAATISSSVLASATTRSGRVVPKSRPSRTSNSTRSRLPSPRSRSSCADPRTASCACCPPRSSSRSRATAKTCVSMLERSGCRACVATAADGRARRRRDDRLANQAITPIEVLQSMELREVAFLNLAAILRPRRKLAEVRKYCTNGTIGSWTDFRVQGRLALCLT